MIGLCPFSIHRYHQQTGQNKPKLLYSIFNFKLFIVHHPYTVKAISLCQKKIL